MNVNSVTRFGEIRMVYLIDWMNVSSVTRFGEILPLWQNWDGLFSIWQNFEPTLAKVFCY